jgi:hypothetical protein
MTPVGFSHSEISGSRPVCDSPELIAANYVLHRHLTPRHSSCALSSLTANLCGFLHERLGGLRHHQLSRHAVSDCSPCETPIPTPSLTSFAGLADADQGRDRSSSSELQSLDSIRRSFSFSRHAFASSIVFQFSENFRVLRPLTHSLLVRRK